MPRRKSARAAIIRVNNSAPVTRSRNESSHSLVSGAGGEAAATVAGTRPSKRGRDEREVRMRSASDIRAALAHPFDAVTVPVELIDGSLAASYFSAECERTVQSQQWA